ncbi:MAG: hypothetical protein JST00_32535 [Deltaproteobacteria bacterium]|nr:hypothetical protein [Deltaproteobacteria bacterium]
MNTRFSCLAALVVTVASFALGGCAADGDGPGAEASESSISEREASRDLHANEGAKLADLVNEKRANDFRREVTADAKVATGERPELTPVPGFPKPANVDAIEALESVTPVVGGPQLDVDMPDLTRR